MTSRLLVDKIEGKTTSGTIQMPAGHVIQTVSTSFSTEVTESGSSFVDTGLSLAITPKFSTSKIMGSFNLSGVATTTNATSIGFKLYRNGSEIQLLDSHFAYNYDEHSDRHHFAPTFIDSPNTTSAVTYSVYAAVQGGSQSAYIFDTHIADGVTHNFILQEVSV